MSLNKWWWEIADPRRSSSSGDISKLFKNEAIKQPGVFKVDAPSADATLLAREVIQNSWDAAIELRENSSEPPPFEIRFTFGSDLAAQARKGLGLEALVDRVQSLKDGTRHELGLRTPNCVERLGQGPTDVPFLMIEESGTVGMYGPWLTDQSKMYLALATVAVHDKRGGTGGSFGFGKSGLIRGSAVRVVVAYSCFKERTNDPGVTRRLLGMAYWGQHHLQSMSFTGFGRFGNVKEEDNIVPWVNEDADNVARVLGIPIREPDLPENLGTSFLLIEPTVDHKDLLKAIERSWWPALEGHFDFNAVVCSESGQQMTPRPKRNPVLKSFIDAYAIASTPSENQRPDRDRHVFRAVGDFDKPGVLGLTADIEGWSYPEQTEVSENERIEHRSLVALVRKPRMVVEYFDAGRAAPYARGTFIADDSVNETLRATEPKGHDAWQTNASEMDEIASSAAKCAEAILNRIKTRVRVFRDQLKPNEDSKSDYDLPAFEKAMRALFHGSASPRPFPEQRPFSINTTYEISEVGAESLVVRGEVWFALSEHAPKEESDVALSIRYVLVEDERAGDEVKLTIEPPVGFVQVSMNDTRYTGRISPGDRVCFEFETYPYLNEWTGSLRANAELLVTSDVE